MNANSLSVPPWLAVSRETIDRLMSYCQMVEKWNQTINLVSKADVSQLWQRHLLDSAQLIHQVPSQCARVCDLGSGGGFPGMVLAILLKETQPGSQVTLVEADRRKSVFLSQVARQLDVRATIKTLRIEELEPQLADMLTARALAPLSTLCAHAYRHLTPDGIAVFPKGATAVSEIEDAQKLWRFECTTIESRSSTEARVLVLRGIQRA